MSRQQTNASQPEAKKPSIRKNYIYDLAYQVLTLLTPFITTPYVSRILGADGVGIQSYTNSIVSYFAILAALGTASYGQREIARNRDDKKKRSVLFWEIELLCAATTLTCLAVWCTVIVTARSYSAFYLVLTMTLAAVAFDISWFFGGLEEYRLIVFRNTAIKLAGIALLFLFVREKDDLLLYVALTAATGLLGNVSMWLSLRRYLDPVSLKELHIRRHFKETLIYFIPTVATSVYTVLDKTMLGLITGDTYENGYYEQTTRIINMAKTVIMSFNAVMSSRMSYLFSVGAEKEIRGRIVKSLNFVLLLGIPIVFGIMGIAGSFVPWFFGPGYTPVIPLLFVCAPLVLIVGLSDCMGSQILTPSGRRLKSSKAIVAGSVINFFLNLLLIPKLQSTGAALASVAAETAITAMYFYLSRDYLPVSILPKLGYKRLIAALVMFLVIYRVGRQAGSQVWVTFVQIGLGAGIYFLLLLAMRDSLVLSYGRELLEKLKRKD